MPVKDGREYRFFAPPAVVEDAGRPYTVRGYYTTFEEPYELRDGIYEVIDRHALDGADMSDVIMQYDHAGMVMARMRNNTLVLGTDEKGGFMEAQLGGCQQGRDLYEAISNGLVDRMSWGFILDSDGWEFDPDARVARITKVRKVFDVSAVSIPANPGTEIHARSYIDGVIEAEAKEFRQGASRRERQRMAALLAIV